MVTDPVILAEQTVAVNPAIRRTFAFIETLVVNGLAVGAGIDRLSPCETRSDGNESGRGFWGSYSAALDNVQRLRFLLFHIRLARLAAVFEATGAAL